MLSLRYEVPNLSPSCGIDKKQYLKAIWNVINFKEAEKRYLAASQK